MVMCRKPSTTHNSRSTSRPRRDDTPLGKGGPVILPPRRPSAMALALMAPSAEGNSVTAYDDLWYVGRPRV